MKFIKNAGLTVTAVALATTASFSYADVDDVARGGLRHLEDSLAVTLDDMQAAIGANTTGVQNNAASAAQNAADNAANSAAAAQNASGISANSAAISANNAAINAMQPVTYDYRDFGTASNIASKIYNIRNISGCDTETRTFDRVSNGANTGITLKRKRTVNGLNCRYHEFKFLNTPDARFRISVDNYNGSGSRLKSTVTLDKPMIMRTSSMQIGQSIGDGTTTTFVDFDAGGIVSQGTYIRKTTILAEDSVTVPLNGGTTFSGCLRYHITHESTFGFGTGPIDRIEYHCPGLGMVKRIQANGGYYELRDVTYN